MPTPRLTAILMASGLVTGCYASSVVDEASSGSRLRARYWVPASGERSFAGWFDTELDRECGFVWLEDGGYRCVPLGTARGGPTYYADAACTEPVVEVIPESPCDSIEWDFMYELVQQREECTAGAHFRFYELDAPMSVSRAFVRRDGECMETTPPDQVRRARRLPPEHFVGAETVRADEPGRGRLGRERLVADDGSTQLSSLFDRERGESCRPGSGIALATTATPCLPFSAANLRCSTEWAPHDDTCGRPDVAYLQSPGTCTTVGDISVFSVGEDLETFAEECRGTTEGYPITGDATGEVAWITPAPDGAGRLQPIVWTDAEGTAVTGGGGTYLDTELGFRCRPLEMADGVTRCLPGIAESILQSAGTFQPGWGPYADAACTQPAVGLTPGCDAEIEWVHETVPIADCPLAYIIGTLRPVGERVDAAYLIDRETGDCVPHDLGSARVPHRLGPALDPAELAVVQLVVE